MTDLLGPASAPNAVTTRVAEYRTFGNVDTWFKPCSSPASQDGTQLQAPVMNGILAQLRGAIRGNGQLANATGPVVPEVNTTDTMLLSAIQLLIARGQPNCATDTGTSDALVAAPATPWPEYVKGARLWVVKSSTAGANATIIPTIAVSGLAAVTIVRRDGSALMRGDLPAGIAMCLQFDGTYFRLVSLAVSDVAAGVQSGKWVYGVDTGAADAAVVTLFPVPTAAVDGMEVLVKFSYANATTSPKVNVSGIGQKSVLKQNGLAPAVGDIQPGYVPLVWDATLGAWRINGTVASDVLLYGPDTSATANTVTVAIPSYGSAYVLGRAFWVKVANTLTGASKVNVNGIGLTTLTRADGTPTQGGDLVAGQVAQLVYDGTNVQIQNLLTSLVPARNSVTFSTGSGSWAVPAGVTKVFAQLWAGGGGGGGSGSASQAGGGGGGGGYVEGWIFISPGTVSLPYAVGAGGTAGNGNTPTNAGAGGTTSFAGGVIYATGGNGGGTNNGAQGTGGNGVGSNGNTGTGVSNVTGVFQASGGNGGNGGYLTTNSYTYGGFGAPSYQQSAIPTPFAGGINGFGPGTGGTGGCMGTGNYLGGAGASGQIKLTW